MLQPNAPAIGDEASAPRSAPPTATATQVPLAIKLLYSLPQLPLTMAVIPMIMFMPQFYTGHLGIRLSDFANILLVAAIFDIVTDPIIGYLSDRTKSRFGRRRPWIIAGTPLIMLSLYQLFMPSGPVDNWHLLGWLLALRLGWTMLQIPYFAWGAEISGDFNERSSITGWRAAFGIVGAVSIQVVLSLALLGFDFGGSGNALWLVGLIVIGLLPLCVGVAAWFVPDSKSFSPSAIPIVRGLDLMWRNGPFRRIICAFMIGNMSYAINMQLFLFFVAAVIGDPEAFVWLLLVANLAALASMPFWIGLSRRVGKHRAWIAGFAAVALTGPLYVFLGEGDIWWMLPMIIIGSAGSATFEALPASMNADIIDLDTLRTGEDRAAWFFSAWQFATKCSMALAGWLALQAVGWFGFDPAIGPENGPSQMLALKVVYAIVPSVCILIAMRIAWNYPITEARHRRLRENLAKRTQRRLAALPADAP